LDKAAAVVEKELLCKNLLKEMNLHLEYMGVGVDRLDYTKGIPERFRAIERFLEKYPEFIGKFTFVELGAPSRTHIKRYHDLIAEVRRDGDLGGRQGRLPRMSEKLFPMSPKKSYRYFWVPYIPRRFYS
jgi:hypothetical protein